MNTLRIMIFSKILFYTCQAFAIPAKNMESYRIELPHVNENTRQLITESSIMNYEGLKIKDENGKFHSTRRIGMVGRSIEIKNFAELCFVTSYFRDKDYSVRALAIIAVIALLEKNNLQVNFDWNYGTLVDTKDKKFLSLTENVFELMPKIKIFDD